MRNRRSAIWGAAALALAASILLLIGAARFFGGPSLELEAKLVPMAGGTAVELTVGTGQFEIGDATVHRATIGGANATGALPANLGEIAPIKPKALRLEFPGVDSATVKSVEIEASYSTLAGGRREVRIVPVRAGSD